MAPPSSTSTTTTPTTTASGQSRASVKKSPRKTEPDSDPESRPYKRRRISHACDDCRRRKIKCDGKQPCSSCAEFNSACTYQVPSKRHKTPRPGQSQVEALQARLSVAESLIREFLPQVDLQRLGSVSESSPSTRISQTPRDGVSQSDQDSSTEPSLDKAEYLPLVENSDQHLRLTETGGFDFHGHSSGAAFLSRITKHFPGLLRYDSRIPFLPRAETPNLHHPAALYIPGASSSGQPKYNFSRLPPRQLARMLCEYSFNHASCLLRIVHVPSFYKRFDALYDAQRDTYTHDEMQYLGLLYSVLALGSMYDVDENDPSNPDHYDEATNRGYKFYMGARLYIKDLAECRDLTTLQALLFIIQFLQATGNLNSCFNLIGVALRSALRMGLHRHIWDPRMTPIESETRKRVFHTTRQMDIYLSTTLGLPIVLQSRDIDQPLPVAVDDDNITSDALHQPPGGAPSVTEAFNAHAKLMDILTMVVECAYPSHATARKATHATYMINCNRLREVEQKLQDWYQQLPAILRPGNNEDVHLHRVQILLRFTYAHVQMMLYRPFMQYSNYPQSSKEKSDERYQAFATAGINVCRNIISIGIEIRNQAALIGPYWFIMYTQFFAVLCLTLYATHCPDKSESADLLKDAVLGKDSIKGLNQKSLAADRLSAALESVFDNLPEHLRSEIQTIKTGIPPQPEQPDIPSRAPRTTTPGYTTPSALAGSQQQWSLPSMTSRSMSGHAEAMGILDGDQTRAGRVTFPMENPIAYPSVLGPGVSAHINSASEETMQLVVPDYLGDINAALAQPFGAAQTNRHPVSDALATFQTNYPHFLEDPIARIFDDLESTDVWNISQARP